MKWLRGLRANRLKDQPAKASEIKTQEMGASQVSIGRFTYGYKNAEVTQWGEGAALSIGAFCSLGGGLHVVLGGNHRADWMTTFPFGQIFQDSLGEFEIDGQIRTKGDVRIGNDVWIGTNVTILSGSEIGNGAVIGTNATVAGKVAPYEVVAGNPARHVRFRFKPEVIARLEALAWWDLPLDVIRRIAPLLSNPPDAAALDRVEAVIEASRSE